MIRFKVDEYQVREKGRTYAVIVFPFVEYMWAYDNWREDGCYMVDGVADAFLMLKYAMAILVEASDKIIYFPCKQKGIGQYYRENYNLILCTPKAQFRRSSWISIRRKMKSSPKRSYVLQYNRKKLDDYYREKLAVMEYTKLKGAYYYLKTEIRKRIQTEHLEEVLGENLFMVLGKEECYFNHYCVAKDLEEYNAESQYGVWSAMGWFITLTGIENMKEDAKE